MGVSKRTQRVGEEGGQGICSPLSAPSLPRVYFVSGCDLQSQLLWGWPLFYSYELSLGSSTILSPYLFRPRGPGVRESCYWQPVGTLPSLVSYLYQTHTSANISFSRLSSVKPFEYTCQASLHRRQMF